MFHPPKKHFFIMKPLFTLMLALGLCSACQQSPRPTAPAAADSTAADSAQAPADSLPDSLQTLRGTVRISPEVRSFTPEGSTTEYWLADRTGQLEQAYDRVTDGRKTGTPVKATLKVAYDGRWDDGFAAQYDGVYLLYQIVSLGEPQ